MEKVVHLLGEYELKLLVRASISLGLPKLSYLGKLSQDHSFGLILSPPIGEWGEEYYNDGQHGGALGILQEVKKSFPQSVLGWAVGCKDPEWALKINDAGAHLIFLNTSFVKEGPGLPKRINNSIAHVNYIPPDSKEKPRTEKQTWFWGLILGLSMFFGGLLAFILSITTVLLPYDESLSGLTVQKIINFNPRLLDFMTHDRATLAGTMFSLGLNYSVISVFAIKRGEHWAKSTLLASSFVGFLTFFTFLGYGYLDLFHAFVTIVLLQFFLLALIGDLSKKKRPLLPPQKNSWGWKLALWAQLLFVFQGIGLILAGLTITLFGSTTVFVPTDMGFLNMLSSQVADLHPNLIPLIAHDRTTFGGMLVSCGVFVLLTALWGFEKGRSWLWWLYLTAGFPPLFNHSLDSFKNRLY